MVVSSRTLPDYAKPPVTETVLDVGFASLTGWGIPHFGLFWNRIRADYPTFEDKPPLALEREMFPHKPQTLRFNLQLMNQPEARCWFIDESQARLIQVQNDRFVHNWRKGENADYPHYEDVIRPVFEGEWSRFRNFLAEEKIEAPQVQQCEVAYINHMELKGWSSFADLTDALESWPGSKGKFLPIPEGFSANTSYLLPDGGGRLRISLEPAVRSADGQSVIQLRLSVRGCPKSSETGDIMKWFDVGRQWIVEGFTDFTSEKMHQIWERII